MKRNLMAAVALICIMTTAMAQTNPTIAGRYNDRFPELPPLRTDFNIVLSNHHHLSQLLMSQADKRDNDSLASQSIMNHHSTFKTSHLNLNSLNKRILMDEDLMGMHIKLKRTTLHIDNREALKSIRDQIVRDRWINEGRPLPPLMPYMK